MKRRTPFILAAALLLPYFTASGALASEKGKSRGPKSPTTVVGFKAELAPVVADGNGEGEAEYKNKSNTRGTVESFSAEVEFEIPDATLGITDLNSAPAAQFELHLSRGGSDYAVCSLAIKETEFKYKADGVEIEAEYAVSVSQETPVGGAATLSEKIGSCILNATGTNGVPTVAAGDTATVFSVQPAVPPAPPSSTAVLTGLFQ